MLASVLATVVTLQSIRIRHFYLWKSRDGGGDLGGAKTHGKREALLNSYVDNSSEAPTHEETGVGVTVQFKVSRRFETTRQQPT